MMYSFYMFQFSLLIIPAIACEGQCIVDVTRAFVGNYTTPVHNVFAQAASKISNLILQSSSSTAVYKLMAPLRNSYKNNAYNTMEEAIFPGYFHGKCQVNGVDPVGCPNPDCPVVCGTPGSLVHFYAVLQQIAFNATASNLVEFCAPSSSAYQAFETAILHEHRTESPSRRSLPSVRSSPTRHSSRRSPGDLWVTLDKRVNREVISDRDVKTRLQSVCKSMIKDLTSQCGGSASLSKCSWEKEMKAFILSFP